MTNRRELLKLAPAAALALNANAAPATLDPTILQMTSDLLIPAGNNLLSFNTTRSDIASVRIALRGLSSHLLSRGIPLSLPSTTPDMSGLDTIIRNAGLNISPSQYAQFLSETTAKAPGLPAVIQNLPRNSPSDLINSYLAALRSLERRMPEAIPGVTPLSPVQFSSLSCCVFDWGSSYVSTATLAVVGLDPAALAVIGVIIVVFWAVSKIGGC